MDKNQSYINDNLPYTLANYSSRAFVIFGLIVYIVLRTSDLLPSFGLVGSFIAAALLGGLGFALGYLVGLAIIKIGRNGMIVIFFLLIFALIVFAGNIEGYPQQLQKIYLTHQNSSEMEQLINFLEEDKTDEIKYYKDPHNGVDYFVCTSFTRALAENASKQGIEMGALTLRNTMSIGPNTRYHAMNYYIIDGKFIIIEPQTDLIYTLETIKKYDGGIYKYITIFPDAEKMTNFGKRKATIDIYIFGKYNESEIIEKFPPRSN